MSRIPLFSLLLVAAACTTSDVHTYEIDAEILVPPEVTRVLEAPYLVEVSWMGEVHGPALLCDDVEGDLVVGFSHSVETWGEVNHQMFTARVVPWPEDEPCDPSLVGTFLIEPDIDVPFVHTFVFEDETGTFDVVRPNHHREEITVEVAFED